MVMMMMKTLVFAVALVVTLTARVVVSEKDNNYYPVGYSNPNVENEMYWRDSINVLQDLSKFSKLYVQFHSCAWSPYDEGCGEASDDSYTTWYLGRTHCFRANAAYSLYGVLKGNNDKGCAKSTYINSFFTSNGMDVFSPVWNAAGVSSAYDYTSECQEGEDGDDDNGGGYGGGTSYANKGDNQGSTSYGLGCNGAQFASKEFRGSNCDGNDEIKIMDELESFNAAIEEVECTQIYSDSGEDNNNNENEDGNIAYSLLTYSKACSLREYPNACPDPYGKLSKYTRALECATGTYCLLSLQETRLGRDIASATLLFVGLIMLWATCKCKWQKTRGPSQMDLIREGSIISSASSALSKASSDISQLTPTQVRNAIVSTRGKVRNAIVSTPGKVRNVIQNFAEAERDEEDELLKSVSHRLDTDGPVLTVQEGTPNVSNPGSMSYEMVNVSSLRSNGSNPMGLPPVLFETPPPKAASAPYGSAAAAIDSTPSTVATFQSNRSDDDRKMPSTVATFQANRSADDRKMPAAIAVDGVQTSTIRGPPSTRSVQIPYEEAIARMRNADAQARIDEEAATNVLFELKMKQKRYKRPVLARMSQRLFGERVKKTKKKAKTVPKKK